MEKLTCPTINLAAPITVYPAGHSGKARGTRSIPLFPRTAWIEMDAPAVRTTDERASHGVELQTREGVQSVRSGVMQLRAAGRIGDAEVVASERWYRDYALAIHGAKDSAIEGSGGSPDGAGVATLAAVDANRKAREAIGQRGETLLIAFVAEGLSLSKIAKQIGADRKELAGEVRGSLIRLAEHYQAADTRQRERAVSSGAFRPAN
jgi:hypothetical protein